MLIAVIWELGLKAVVDVADANRGSPAGMVSAGRSHLSFCSGRLCQNLETLTRSLIDWPTFVNALASPRGFQDKKVTAAGEPIIEDNQIAPKIVDYAKHSANGLSISLSTTNEPCPASGSGQDNFQRREV